MLEYFIYKLLLDRICSRLLDLKKGDEQTDELSFIDTLEAMKRPQSENILPFNSFLNK